MSFLLLLVAASQLFWKETAKLQPYRLAPSPVECEVERLDLNSDGKVDAIRTVTKKGVPVLWLDDDANMKPGDTEGDLVNDCLLLDRDKDGTYDLVVKYADCNGDGRADYQFVLDYLGRGHYMVVADEDRDGVFNYINWDRFQLECWEKNGISDFFTDYSGNTSFLKAHRRTEEFKDLRLNWENPFIFYDTDGDGLSEMAVRCCDFLVADSTALGYAPTQYHGEINWVSIAYDLDNDNCEGNDFDFDLTLNFRASAKHYPSPAGFSYMDCVHPLRNMRGLPEADRFFPDPRIRHLTELIYPDRRQAPAKIASGRWDSIWLTYDEDDDCGRWERVELYEPKNPFKAGTGNGGVDNNRQSDPTGDRGEWDKDASGAGQLYVGRFDGRIHLYGAETGCWRIDQKAGFYQGWDRRWLKREPSSFATVFYEDKDGNGFFDTVSYDLDSDGKYETVVSLRDLGIDDRCELVNVRPGNYPAARRLFDKVSASMWKSALKAVRAAEKAGVNPMWYAKMLSSRSAGMRYRQGWFLQFYIFKDLEFKYICDGNGELLKALTKAYYSSDWDSFIRQL